MRSPDQPIYLDHNATTPILPEVLEAMLPYLRTEFGNPSSGHALGRRARDAVEEARARVARLLGCQAGEVVFTSGGTEASNLAIRGTCEAMPERRHVVTSVVEHPATANPCRHLEALGHSVDQVEVDSEGRVRLHRIAEAIGEETSLVTIMHANNETGTLQPIREIAELSRARGARVHTDAAQSLGKIPVNVDALSVDLLTVAGHKLNAPKGVGALYVRRGTPLRPFLLGAGHERGLRPGTENVAGIVGLGAACEIAGETLEVRGRTLLALRERLLGRLAEAIPGIRVNGEGAERLPNTLSLRLPDLRGSAWLEATPEVAAGLGSACHEGREKPSAVLLAMGILPDEALRSVRLSLGATTDERDVDLAADALVRGYRAAAGRA